MTQLPSRAFVHPWSWVKLFFAVAWPQGPLHGIALVLTYAVSEAYPYQETWVERRSRRHRATA